MAHEIFGDRFLGRQTPAWHGLGTTFDLDREIGAEEATREAGCGYELRKVKYPDISVFGQRVEIPRYGVFREPTTDDPSPRWLGDVGADYGLFDNLSIARSIEPLVRSAKFKGGWPVETVGALRSGDSFFITLKVGRTLLAGSDAVDRYFLINGNHANGQGIHIVVSTVRVVCANTLELALESATSGLTLLHTGEVEQDFEAATALMAKLHDADDSAIQTLQALATARVVETQVQKIIDAAFPEPREPRKAAFVRAARERGLENDVARFAQALREHEQAIELIHWNREAATKCYANICRTAPDIAETAWAALNACTEVSNHRAAHGGNVAESIVFGGRRLEMVRALREAVSVAGLRSAS